MIKFGLVGYGAIGEVRAQALKGTPEAKLSLIIDPVQERRKQAKAAHSIRVSSALQDLLDDDAIDAVIVSTPPNLHRVHCEAALMAGKHVLCEKPLAPTPQDCRSIVETALKCGRVLATGFNYRFYPGIVLARQWIEQGRIGQVTHVKSVAGHPGGPEFTHQWVHDPRIVGGGALMDNGIHLADLTLLFLGPVETSCGFTSHQTWQFQGTEDNGFVLMQTSDGRIGSLHATWTAWKGYHWQVEIHGTRGSIQVSYPPMMAALYDRPLGAAKRGKRHLELFPVFQVFERLRSYRWTVVQSFIAEQTDFISRLKSERGSGATGLDGLRAVELAMSAYAHEHAPVEKFTAQTHVPILN
ncbi:MAG: Gfo/Idh/MocA family oxidoreductase [Anaerolineae bacterium]|nr:Gfo/Idh/MocA family oxidoreductase [Anaerolineae bacterium]